MAGEDTESRVIRHALVQTLRRDGHLRSAAVAAAMEAVPRERFVPGLPLDEVYRPGDAIVTKRVDGISVSSASSPEVVAVMLEQLGVRPGDRVLEIGAGTGYNAALLAHLVGDTGRVVTMDIDDDLVQTAREHLVDAGYGKVEVVLSDGALGSRDDGVYDRIILTVSSSDIAPAWREQLTPHQGRLVMPLGLRGPQRSVAFTPAGDHLLSDSVRNCSFIPLRGLLAPGSVRVALEPQGARVLTGVDEPLPLEPETIAALLGAPLRSWRSGISMSASELREGLHLWLVTHDRGTWTLWGSHGIPDLFGAQDVPATLCVLDANLHSLAVLAWAENSAGSELVIRAPVGGDRLAARVRDIIQDWHAAGRPTDRDLVIRAYPGRRCREPAVDEVLIRQRWSSFVLTWRKR